MKNTLLIILFTLLSLNSFGQDFSKLSQFKFNNIEDYKETEPKVLECANYLFDNPLNQNEVDRLTSIQYIMKWMEGTPDYTFAIGNDALEITKGSSDLFALYLAAMTKVVLENTGAILSNEAIHNQSTDILVNYCENPENNIKPSKAIKKILKKK